MPLVHVVGAIAKRLSAQSGDHPYLCARDLRDAVERWLNAEIFLATLDGSTSWRDIGEQLGVSAQAAHRKYGHSQRGDY